MRENEKQQSEHPRRILVRQFRISTLLWITLVVGAFFAGRYSDEFMTPPSSPQAPLTATWNPGRSVPMAITGPIDIDGDGANDLAELKTLITNNGGTIVAFQDTDGSYHGNIDATTRYLVVGKSNATALASNRLVLDAKKYSVQQIDVAKFLKLIGVRSNSKSKKTQGFPSRKQWGTQVLLVSVALWL
jgi:hypothetical protein